jgi:c(7)-type cytochrome triheme protein
MCSAISCFSQESGLDYSKFAHTSAKHVSIGCVSCHERSDNSSNPSWPGHKACTGCHIGQFTTPAIPMCQICHSDLNGSRPPLRSFPVNFKETFNVRFDHAQHMSGFAKPKNGCEGCHLAASNRGTALSIPAELNAHTVCYSCHTPASQSSLGHEIASCGVCHALRSYNRTSTNARSFRIAFSHAKHTARERLTCSDCHSVTASAAQSRQVSSPAPSQHFPSTRGPSCATCHSGRRAFGGDLGFDDCRRCHTGQTFRMPT